MTNDLFIYTSNLSNEYSIINVPGGMKRTVMREAISPIVHFLLNLRISPVWLGVLVFGFLLMPELKKIKNLLFYDWFKKNLFLIILFAFCLFVSLVSQIRLILH